MAFRASALAAGLAAAGLFASPATAQQRVAVPSSHALAAPTAALGGEVLRNYDPAAEQVVYTVTGGGYVYGTNSYGDLSKSQCFEAPATPIQIQGVTFYMVRSASADDMAYSVVLSEGAPGYDGEPGTGPGAPIYSQDFDTIGLTATEAPAQAVEHPFDTPQTVESSFCIGVQWGSSEPLEGLGMAAQAHDPSTEPWPYDWELWSDGASWYNVNEAWTDFRAVMWVDVLYTSAGTSAEDSPEAAAARVRVMPNPSASTATLAFTSATAQRVAVDIFNVLGQRVASLPAVTVGAGEQSLALPVDGLAPGAYAVRVQAEAFTAVRQISIVR